MLGAANVQTYTNAQSLEIVEKQYQRIGSMSARGLELRIGNYFLHVRKKIFRIPLAE